MLNVLREFQEQVVEVAPHFHLPLFPRRGTVTVVRHSAVIFPVHPVGVQRDID